MRPEETVSLNELIPSSYLERLDLEQIFGRRAPLEVDLGCGDGAFLAALAAQDPAHDFLGIERLAGRVRAACHRASKLPNIRILRIETAYAVRYLLPSETVHVFYLFFPDPWPKRRHHQRRLVKQDFLDAVFRSLAPNGLLRIATDQQDYFTEIQELVRRQTRFRIAANSKGKLPVTKFEKRFLELDQPIYRLDLEKI